MDLAFQVVGMIAVAVVGLALVVGITAALVLRKKLMGVVGGEIVDAAMEPAPRRLRLQRTLGFDWSDPDSAIEACEIFSAAGFAEIAHYESYDLDGLHISAWIHEEQRLYGVVYDHPRAGIFSDVVGFFEDGGTLTVGNSRDSAQLDTPPQHLKIVDASFEVDQLIERAQAEASRRPLRAVDARSFQRAFEREYALSVDWRNARGGPSEAEIRRIAASMAEKVDDRIIGVARERYAEFASEQLAESCLDHFMADTLMSVADWEKSRDSVVVVHDRMSSDQVVSAFSAFVDLPDDLAAEIFNLEPAGTPARDFFQHLNLCLEAPVRYRLLGSVQQPVAADVYAGTSAF